MKPRPIEDYHEDMGNVLWWRFPIDEPPYVGSPRDLGQTVEIRTSCDPQTVRHIHVGGWPGYHTHFTEILIPDTPE
ncbi:MAG: hypothetical protein AAGL24_09860 [Pseudomonadota bacterium]